jgi:ubiquinol-cytochrome c reductase cytochrome c subunit
MPTFSRTRLSDRQLDSVIRYVQWAKHPDNRGGWSLGDVGPVPEGLVTGFIAASVLLAVCMVIGRRIRG